LRSSGSGRRFSAIVAAALISGCALPGHSAEGAGPLCAALDMFASEALRASEVQQSVLFKERPMEIACSSSEGDSAQQQYCQSVIANVSSEFTHAYPWQVRSCIAGQGGTVKVTTAPEYTGLTGRDKIIRLEGALRSGVKVGMTFTPSCRTEAEMDPGGGCYWGFYKLTLTPPT
jgi:hypothetical protein